jgi:hypothetical protein
MLPETELIRLLKSPESHWVERKPSGVNDDKICNTLVAFANSVSEGQHAVLFIGVSDDGKLQGVENADQKQKDVTRISEHRCYPPVKCEPTAIRVDDVELVAVVVGASSNRPHFSGHAYVRKGSESKKASPELFEEMIATRNDKVRLLLAERKQLINVAWKSSDELPKGFKANITLTNWLVQQSVIVGCDAVTLELEDASTGKRAHIPLAWVTLGRTPEHSKRKLYVTSKS